MIRQYIKRPIPVKALQWLKSTPWSELEELVNNSMNTISYSTEEQCLYIKTLEGTMKLEEGSYLVKGVRGELYPCEKSIFEETYEEVTNE